MKKRRLLGDLTLEEQILQAISFAYGNLSIENPSITREKVEKTVRELYKQKESKK